MPFSRQPYTLDRVVRLVITVVLVIVAIWLVNILKGVLLPFLVACLIAYLFEPMVQFNRRMLHLRGRGVAIFVTLFEALFLLSLILYFFVPMLIDEVTQMAAILKAYGSSDADIPYFPKAIHEFLKRNIDFNLVGRLLTKEQIASIAENALSTSWSIITGSISMIVSLVSWLIVVLYVVFIMIDYERLSRGFRAMVPPRYRRPVFRLLSDVEVSMNHYFRGQSLIAFLVGVLFSIGFSIIGLPMAVMLGMFIGILNMVPYLQLISIVPTAFLCLIYTAGGNGSFWTICWQSLAVYIIVQAIQDLVLTPRIMGKAMGLNPAIILLSLSVWGVLLGFIGLIIALPLTTLILSYYNRYIIKG
ncbi:MAG: AI-2E family transporter [Paramuribaculum sp.]|nr:AI-2E family transporter [Paramuribaculum sp.]